MEKGKIQWHPAFVAAMDLELGENRKDLVFEKEYNLNSKPLEIDLLVIKKETGAQIVNEIGKLFRGHNIMEYKSPRDHLDIDTFYKVGAYASLYKSYGKLTDDRKADDITVSLIRETKPRALFQYFEEHNMLTANPYSGIYYVLNGVLFPTQIIVTNELDKKNHAWLTALTEKMQKNDMKNLIEKVDALTQKYDKGLAESVLEVSVSANRGIIDELRGEKTMYEVLMEIMEPEIEKREKERIEKAQIEAMREGRLEGRQEGRKEAIMEGIINAISVIIDLGHPSEIAVSQTALKYQMTEEEVLQIWNNRNK